MEWKECAVPLTYRLEYGSPSIAAMSSNGQSLAIASTRGVCVLECSQHPSRYSTAGEDRGYMLQEPQSPKADKETSLSRRNPMHTPKWHFFGNESEEKAFRVLAMTWWQGEPNTKAGHTSGDLLVAVIQLYRKQDSSNNHQPGAFLACWSQRRY